MIGIGKSENTWKIVRFGIIFGYATEYSSSHAEKDPQEHP